MKWDLYDFNLYTPYNTIFYENNIAPSIDMLIKYIRLNNMKYFLKISAGVNSNFDSF